MSFTILGSGRGSSEPDGRSSGSSGGASGGRGGGKRDVPTPADVSEQIATALERLQRDMNSVLIRLNTLEALALSRQQVGLGSFFNKAKKIRFVSKTCIFSYMKLDLLYSSIRLTQKDI